jgi:hypothetical protein
MAKTVNLKASDLATGQTAQFRDLTFTPAGGSATTIKVLSTAAATIPPSSSPGTLTEVTFVSAVQISGQYLQVKTRTGKVYDPGTESGWTTVYTAPAYDD